MKKQMKIAAVVSATALLALGASFTSMAATYDWKTDEAGESVCYDADGTLITDAWAEWEGNKYFMDGEGHIVKDSWIEGDEDELYFVDENGAMVKNNWVETFAYEAEDEDEMDWFHFGADGELSTQKRISWKDTYYFVDEEGKMLTGWVEYSKTKVDGKYVTVSKPADNATVAKNLIYVNEDGKIAADMWLNDFGPDYTEEDKKDLEDKDLNWYYIKSNGYVQTGKAADINGNTYYFADKEATADGVMLTGWVQKVDTNQYAEFDGEIGKDVAYKSLFYCGGKDEGWMKKNQWVKTFLPEDYANADADVDDTYWYWLTKEGYVYIPNKATSTTAVKFANGESEDAATGIMGTFTLGSASNAQELEVNKKTYLFNQNGQMMSGLVKIGDETFYYGESTDGAKKTGSQDVKDAYGDYYTMFFATNTKNGESAGAAITGREGKNLYVNGLLQVAGDSELYKVVKVGKNKNEYIVDENGVVQTSTSKKYEFENKDGIWKVKKFDGKNRTANHVLTWDEQKAK